MMIYQEKIAPPLAIPLTDDEQMKVIAEAVGSEDRWVNSWRCSGHKALKQGRLSWRARSQWLIALF
jgi:hypothetical protein